jgi:5-methylcytosine-specific restriction endonuclease McrA
MIDRRRLTLRDKLEIMARQSRCPLCGERLGPVDNLDWDHETALARGGTDTLDNIRAVHRACHLIKTSGTRATTRGSDIHEIAKTKRLEKAEAEFRARLLSKDPEERLARKAWPSRPFPKRRKTS